MIQTKSFADGGMTSDVEESLIRQNDWIDALNIRIGSPDIQAEGVVSNAKGNRELTSSYSYPAGVNKVIGSYPDEIKNRIYVFLWNSNNNHRILYINTQSGDIVDVLQNLTWTSGVDILRWKASIRINDIDIIIREDTEGDLLFWIDGNAPRKINVLKGERRGLPGGYPSVIIENYITVAKNVALPPLFATYANVAGNIVNNLRRKLFQFRYRWIYDDSEKSPWGGWSNMPVPVDGMDPDVQSDPTKNCAIDLAIITGDATVKKIEIAVRQNVGNVWGDTYVFETLDKAKLGLSDNALHTYRFTNNNAGVISNKIDSDLTFSDVPLIANAQELVNGNTLVYGAITSGFDTPDNFDVTVTGTSTIVPLTNAQCFKTWKHAGKYRLGMVYYDTKGRTDGVHTYVDGTDDDFEVDTPAYTDNSAAVPPTPGYAISAPGVQIIIRHQPPEWAVSYRMVRSQCLTFTKFINYVVAVKYIDADYIYVSLSDLNKSINDNGQAPLTYDFVAGDRMRFIRMMRTPGGYPVYPNVEVEIVAKVEKPTIGGSPIDGTFIKMRNSAAINTALVNYEYLVEIYSPSQISDKIVFYEFGEHWSILNPGTATRAHEGHVDQDVLTNTPATLNYDHNYGDVYMRQRIRMTAIDSAGTDHNYDYIPLQDMNYEDAYASAVNDNGRPLVVVDESKRTFYPTMVRFSGQYLQGTTINQTNIFYPDNFDEYDRNFGAIKRLRARDRSLRVFQELKVGLVPVYQQVIKQTVGSDVLSQSDKLLNNIQYYSGEYGIGNAPDSLASNNYSDYFVDPNRGAVIRLSNDGLTPISIIYSMNNFFTNNLKNYKVPNTPPVVPPTGYLGDARGDAAILGAFDAQHNEYVISLTEIAEYAPITFERTVVVPAKTLSFNEGKNRYTTYWSYLPEYETNIGVMFVTFKNGRAYAHDSDTHCNYYGVQYDSYITTVFNKDPHIKKTFLSLDEFSSAVWEGDQISTSLGQSSNLIPSDFESFEGHYHASFLGDSSSPGGIIEGDSLKGGWIKIRFRKIAPATFVKLITAAVNYIPSNENVR